MDKPRPNDLVLGNNQAPNTPCNAVVLGGILGAKQRLNSTSLSVKLEALISALQYNDEGIKLVHEFIAHETDASIKWVASNWVWLHASEASRAKLINHITCLKYISFELMELVLLTIISDSSSSKVMPTKDILEEIDKVHEFQTKPKSLGRHQKSAPIMTGRLSNKPHSPSLAASVGYQELGDLYSAQNEEEQLNSTQLRIIIIAYQEAIKYNKNLLQSSDMLNKRGLAHYYLYNYQAAIRDYNKAIKFNPYFASAYNNRGCIYDKLGDDKAAIKDYNQAIKLDSNFALPYYNRGLIHYTKGDYQAAIEDSNQAIRINPTYTDAYITQGLAYYMLGDYQAAIENYNQAIKINPNSEPAYYKRGHAREYLEDYQNAIEDYTQAIKINPNNSWTYFSRGYNYYILKDYLSAIDDYNQVIKINPSEISAYLYLAYFHSETGEKLAAINHYHQAANLYKQQGNESGYEEMLNYIKELEK